MSKFKNMKMHLFYALMQLLLECLYDLKPTTERMKQSRSDLTEMCELLNDEVSNTYTIQKSTYFSELTNKINTIMRKTFNQNM